MAGMILALFIVFWAWVPPPEGSAAFVIHAHELFSQDKIATTLTAFGLFVPGAMDASRGQKPRSR